MKKMSLAAQTKLAAQLRQQIIKVVDQNGGHLGSNLGVVELTIAWHQIFDSPTDQLVWDVGHQCYSHKILTDRAAVFETLKLPTGISGFPTRLESVHDPFGTGHASTSISAAAGLMWAKKITGQPGTVTAVIGDASLGGGLALEAFNHLGSLTGPALVILNQNNWAIDELVGGLSQTNAYQTWAQSQGWQVWPEVVDGHHLAALNQTLSQIKKELNQSSRPVFLIVKTQKGHGLDRAEQDPVACHALSSGSLSESPHASLDWDDLVSQSLRPLLYHDQKKVVISAAMCSRSGLAPLKQEFPDRVIDTGITESHAVTLAAGMAAGGLKPWVMIASTFLQRSYDQIIHDVLIQKLPVRFLIDRTGLSADRVTHDGIYDLNYLLPLPNLNIWAPTNEATLLACLDMAAKENEIATAVRFPKIKMTDSAATELIHLQQAGEKVAVLQVGKIVSQPVLAELIRLQKQFPTAAFWQLTPIKPLPITWLKKEILPNYQTIITVEDGVVTGGWGQYLNAWLQAQSYQGQITNLGLTN